MYGCARNHTEDSMSLEHNPARQRAQRPRFDRIPAAVAYSGISRSRLYQWAGKRPGLFVKNGTATLVNLGVLDELLDALPPAEIKANTDTPNTTIA
jgi:hypothetical protein